MTRLTPERLRAIRLRSDDLRNWWPKMQANQRRDVEDLLGHVAALEAELQVARGERFGTDPAALGASFAEAQRAVVYRGVSKWAGQP